MDSESEEVQSESGSEVDSEPEVDSESGGVDSESRELPDAHAPSPPASDRPETAVTDPAVLPLLGWLWVQRQ